MSPCRSLRGESGEMCELHHTLAVVQKMQGALSFWIASRSSFLIGELPLGKLSETVVVQGNAPHNRPCFLVGHLVGNRASFTGTNSTVPNWDCAREGDTTQPPALHDYLLGPANKSGAFFAELVACLASTARVVSAMPPRRRQPWPREH